MSGSHSFTGSRLIRELQKIGFKSVQTKGSLHFLQHQDGRHTVVPAYRGETLGRGLLAKIFNDCEIALLY